MMRASNIKMTTKVKRENLLKVVRDNYVLHQQIIKEAQESYRKKAIELLQDRLEAFQRHADADLFFTLKKVEDYSEVYKNSIEMLEWNESEYIELTADEFRQLVRDEWDWSERFFRDSSWLSESAGGALIARGYKCD